MAVTSPLAYWKFDESSGDAIDSVSSLSAVNTSVTYGAGKLNNGAIYNGSAFHSVADTANIKPSSDISFGGWVLITSTSSFQMMCAKGENTGDTRSYEMRCNGTTTNIQVQLRVGGGLFCACTSTTAIGTGTWAHVIYTRTGTTQKIYINGVSDTLTSVTNNSGTIDYSTDSLWFGQRNGGLRFNGKLDEWGIWNVALTPAEVRQIYNYSNTLAFGSYSQPPVVFSEVSSTFSLASSTSHSQAMGTFSAVVDGIGYALYDCSGTGIEPTTVNWNGSAMTKLQGIDQPTRVNRTSVWYILAPATGSVTITDTFASANPPNVTAIVYAGAKQTAPEASNSLRVATTTISNTITTVANNALVASFSVNNFGTATALTNTVGRILGVLSIGDANALTPTSSSVTQSYGTGGADWTMVMVSMAPNVVTSTLPAKVVRPLQAITRASFY